MTKTIQNKKLGSMFQVDLRRMKTTPLFYIMAGISLLMPVLILVMTNSLSGSIGIASAMNIIGSAGGMSMDLTAMVNINLLYFIMGVYLCLFIGEEFRSGYVKNLFTVRAQKKSYVVSKTMIGAISGTVMLFMFLIGTIIGGNIAGLPIMPEGVSLYNVIMCMIAKMMLMLLFAGVFTIMAVIGKRRTWLSILLSLFGGMLLFMIIPLVSPLSSGIMNAGLCAAGGILFAMGLGVISNMLLLKQDLI